MMKKLFLLFIGAAAAFSQGFSQQILLEQTLLDATVPAGWTNIDVDGAAPLAFFADQGIFQPSEWTGVNFGGAIGFGLYSCSEFDDGVVPTTTDDWIITEQVNLLSNSRLRFELNGLAAGMSVEILAATTLAGATPAPGDFTLVQSITPAGTQAWEAIEVDLIAYANMGTYLAFRNTTNDATAGNQVKLLGLRNVQVVEIAADDITLNSISIVGAGTGSTDYLQADFDYAFYGCGGDAAAQVEIEVENTGLNPITGFDAYYIVDSFGVGVPNMETVVLGAPLAAGATTTYTFTTTADFSNGDPFFGVAAWADVAADMVASNDTGFLDFIFTPATWDVATDGDWEEGFEQVDFNVGQINIASSSWGWTLIDANTDNVPASISAANAGDPRSGDFTLGYFWNNDAMTGANEFAYSPCISLVAGTAYQLSAYAAAGDDGNGNVFPERFRFILNSTPVVGGVTTVGGINDVISTSYEQFSGSFLAPSTGTYHVGVNVNSAADQFFLNIDDMVLTTIDATPNAGVSVVANSVDEVMGTNNIEYCDGMVSITNTTSGVVDDVEVDWGDGSAPEPFTGATMDHTYGAVGTYTITLTATNLLGSTTATAVVDYQTPPAADAQFVVTGVSGLDALVLANDYPDCFSLLWAWGDNTTSMGNQTSHTYSSGGTYTITLTVQGVGSVDQISVDVMVVDGINDINFAEAINIFPTPANSNVSVTFELGNAQDATINLFSMDGKIIETRVIDNALNVNETFNVANINSGIYMMEIVTEEGTSAQRFVVNH